MQLRLGPIDVHCHVVPEGCFTVPGPNGEIEIAAHDGELYYGTAPLAISPESLSDVDLIVEDMDRAGIAVRALSPPPFTFVTGGSVDAAAAYATLLNDSIMKMCASNPTRLLGLLTVPLVDTDAAVAELRRIKDMPGVRGITVPALVGDDSLNEDPLRTVITEANREEMCVVVHPQQRPGPALDHHYLVNLLGNPTESATAIGAIILSGMADAMPDLRIGFFHGGGCAPYVLSRWDHAWHEREDVRSDTDRVPSETFRDRLFIDTLTHGVGQAQFLESIAGVEKLVIGSDYPFDMAHKDPVGAARQAGLDIERLTENARRFLNL